MDDERQYAAGGGVRGQAVRDDRESPADESDVGFRLVPANVDDVVWSAQAEAFFLPRADMLPPDVLKAWFEANPGGFFVLLGVNGTRAGHVEVLPLRPGVLRKLVNGQITETQVSAKDIYPPDERSAISTLYISSMAICMPGRGRTEALRYVISHLRDVGESLCPVGQVRLVYAIAATRRGRQLMDQLGFHVAVPGTKRQDGHDMLAIRGRTLIANTQHF